MIAPKFNKPGEITVFLCLILSVVMTFLCVVFESARAQTIKLEKEIAVDAALRSCFGEYNKKLYERYKLLYIDSSYRSGSSSVASIENHLKGYMEQNLDFDTEKGGSDLLGIKVEDVSIKTIMLATDEKCTPVYNQAVRYMTNYGDIGHIGRINSVKGSIPYTDADSILSEWDNAIEEVHSFGVDFINPAEEIRLDAGNGAEQIYELRKGHVGNVSYSAIPSMRVLDRGNYGSITNSRQEAIFTEYVLQHCGSFIHPKSGSQLSSEQEYLIYGKNGDRENTLLNIERLIRIFASENMDVMSERYEEIKEYAEEIVPPETSIDPLRLINRKALVDAVIKTLEYAYAQTEAILKTDRLLGGGKVSADNPNENWILPLGEITEYRGYMGLSGGSGYTYEEFSSVFLRNVRIDKLLLRFMDVVEMNLRKNGSPGFKVDGCAEYMEAYAETSSIFGHNYNINREYSYETKYKKNMDI